MQRVHLRPWTNTLVVGCGFVLLTPAIISATPAPASGGSSFTLISSVQGMTLHREVRHGDGTITATYNSTIGAVAVTGDPGATVLIRTYDGKDLSVVVQSPQLSKEAARAAAVSYRTRGRSPAADARHAGVPATDSARTAPSEYIYDSWCVSVSGDSNRAYGHVCDVEKVMQQNGGDWYIGDEVTGTGRDTGNGLYSFLGADFYGSGNTLVKWAPSGTLHPSTCNTVTFGLSYGAASVSSTATLCPDTIDPVLNAYGPGFGEFWHGNTKSYVGLNPVDVIHDPPGASPSGSLHVYIHWR